MLKTCPLMSSVLEELIVAVEFLLIAESFWVLINASSLPKRFNKRSMSSLCLSLSFVPFSDAATLDLSTAAAFSWYPFCCNALSTDEMCFSLDEIRFKRKSTCLAISLVLLSLKTNDKLNAFPR